MLLQLALEADRDADVHRSGPLLPRHGSGMRIDAHITLALRESTNLLRLFLRHPLDGLSKGGAILLNLGVGGEGDVRSHVLAVKN